MSFLFFGNNQKTISDLFSSSAAKIVIRASGKNAFSVAADTVYVWRKTSKSQI